MGVLDAKKTFKSLLSKGFRLGKGDHNFLEFYHNGKYILQTKISHGEKELEDFHIGMMKRQCRLEKADFLNLVTCPLSESGYVEILKKKGVITDSDAAAFSKANNTRKRRKSK